MQLEMKSPAKVNLALHILGKRTDGYHDLETILVKISLFDDLVFKLIDQPSLELICPDHPELETQDNLILQAARALLPAGKGLHVRLTKRIPHGAGLGGGSANAAVTIRAVDQLCGLQMTQEAKIEVAARLGADVPFFLLRESAAFATGTGVELMPITNFPALSLVLVVPTFRVSTAWAYSQLDMSRIAPPQNRNALTLSVGNDKKNSDHVRWGNKFRVTDLLHNDLETAVLETHQAIQVIKEELLKLGALGALMSGSGSSVFGIFDNAQVSEQACAKLATDKTLWVRAVTTLTT